MSHLILGVNLVYSTWQAFNQALLANNPLFSYIDVRHVNFLPLRFTVGKARDLGPRYTCSNELAPIRDESVERVSQRHQEQAHMSIQPEAPVQPEVKVEPEAPFDPEAPAHVAEEASVESVSSSETEFDQGHDMVTRKAMTISRFVSGARPATQ